MISTIEREDRGEEGFTSSRRKEEKLMFGLLLMTNKKNVPTN